MRNKWLVLVLALALALSVSVGSQALAQDKTVLRVWTSSSGPAENAFKEAQFAAFEEANPDIDLEVLISPDYGTQIQAGYASGDYPEVFTVGQFDAQSLVDSGLLAPAEGKIEDPDDIYQGLRDAFTVDGTLYCPAKDFSTLVVFYNKDYFEAAGLDAPTSDWTWDDMYAAAEAITNADIKTAEGADVVGFSAAADRNRWLALFQANGAKLFDDAGDVAFDSPAAVEALTYYRSFVENGVGDLPSNLGGAGWNGEAFGRGLAAMTIEGNWAIGALNTDFPDLNWGVAEIPVAPSGGRGTLLFTECWAVSAQVVGTPKEEAAWKLVNFLTGAEGAMANAEAGFGVMPSRASASQAWLDKNGAELEAFVKGADYAWSPVFPLGYGDFTTAVDEGTTDVMGGTVTPEEALKNAADIAREIKEEGM